jgi:hypothetical protein
MAAHHASPLMHAALEPEMDEHLATEAGRVGGRVPFGRQHAQWLRANKVMTEVGAVTVRVPRDRLGTFRPQLLPSYVRRTGALDDILISLTAKSLTGHCGSCATVGPCRTREGLLERTVGQCDASHTDNTAPLWELQVPFLPA